MGTPLQVTASLSLAAFKILPLCSILGKVIMMCLGVCFLGSNFSGSLEDSWKSIFLCRIGEALFHYFFKYVFNFLLFIFFSFWHPYDSDVGTFKVVPEVPKPLLIFLNSCFSILFWLKAFFFFLFQIIDLGPGFLPFTVGSPYIFIPLCIAFIFPLYFVSILNHFCEHPDYQCFELRI